MQTPGLEPRIQQWKVGVVPAELIGLPSSIIYKINKVLAMFIAEKAKAGI